MRTSIEIICAGIALILIVLILIAAGGCTVDKVREWIDPEPAVTVSPRYPLSATWGEFQNGEEATIHLTDRVGAE